jgi:uncharacterized protein
MILRFSVRNWMSYQGEAVLDMVATSEKQHGNHLLHVPKYKLKVLPIAAIYGANASGKSNLTKAIRFAEKFVSDPPKPGGTIPVREFLLGRNSEPEPTEFRFDFLVEETIYRYEFSITPTRVVREELFEVRPRSEEMLFVRDSQSNVEFKLSEKLAKANEGLRFAFQGTQENQLFLTNSVSQKHLEFKPVFDWFDDLTIIMPDMSYGTPINLKASYANEITSRLRDLDSGIESFTEQDLPLERLPKQFIEAVAPTLKEGRNFPLSQIGMRDGEYLVLENGNVRYRRLMPIHRSQGGTEVPFPLTDESDGTRRLLNLLPVFYFLDQSFLKSVYIVDELDRSLHSNLTKSLIEHFLDQRDNSSHSQLIFTTHDTELMSQKILRRDEIWITERNKEGASTLTPFSEFRDVRKDKDIRKSYLQGRMGGVPRILDPGSFCDEEVKTK